MSAPSLVDVLLDSLTDEQAAEFAKRLLPFLNGAGQPPALIGPDQAAHRLGIHVRTLTRAAAAGRVAGAVKVGRGWRFKPDELALAPPERSRPAPPPPPSTTRSERCRGGDQGLPQHDDPSNHTDREDPSMILHHPASM